MRGSAIKSVLVNQTSESRSGWGGYAVLILCLLISPSAGAYLWVRSGPGQIRINPEELIFRTGKAGDEVSMSVSDIKSGGFSSIWHSTYPMRSAQDWTADYYESYVSSLPPGSDSNWYKLTDILEFSAQNSYYGSHTIESSLHYSLSLPATIFHLGYEGQSTPDSLYLPWAQGTTLRFRLTKDVVDSPVFIPAMDLFSFFSMYVSSTESSAQILLFGKKHPPEWLFSINSGFISVPQAACSVSPTSLDVDFGTMPSSRVNGAQQKKELQITCNKNAALKLSIQGVDSAIDNGATVLKMSNRDDIVARVKTDNLADQDGYFPLSVKKDVPISIPFFFELQSTGSKPSPAPGQFDGSGWVIFSYQ
ncbi:fimbrial protein [Salmonella enterica subsp. enterica serovar Bredeney]|nr:fimbrial protein [Salmonella enterica subsp. enterica serovar Bredeney]